MGGVGEEDGLDVGIVHTYVLHAILFLVTAGKLMLLDDTRHVVLDGGTYDEAVLCLAVHRLSVDIVVLLVVLYEPALISEEAEVLSRLCVDLLLMLVSADWEVDLGTDDVVEGHLVARCFGTSFVAIEYVVGARGHTLYEVLGWADTTEWFDDSHRMVFVLV